MSAAIRQEMGWTEYGSAGAASGREKCAAVDQMYRGVAFAADDRSYVMNRGSQLIDKSPIPDHSSLHANVCG